MQAIGAFLFIVMFSLPALAAEQYALTMHGAPELSAGFTHFPYTSSAAKKGGHVTRAGFGTFDTLNHMNIKGKPALGLNLIYDRLMARSWDEPFSLYPLIAQKIDISDDRSQITYFLNKSARFHDGHPVTAEDVMFSYQALRDKGKPIRRQVYALIKEAKIIDDHTISFSFAPGYDRETVMILSIMQILPKHYWENKAFDQTSLAPPLGSGPYKISAVEPGRKITYERVKNYWAQDLPSRKYQYNFDEITYDYYRDQTIAYEAFKAGEIDIWHETDPLRWQENFTSKAKAESRHVFTPFYHQRPAPLKAMIFNTRKDKFKDIRVRKALSIVFNSSWINRVLFDGNYNRVNSIFTNSYLTCACWTPTSGQNHRQNLRRASLLLQEAGWRIVDGIFTNDQGEKLAFEILLQDPREERIALNYASSLRKLGVEASIRPVDSAQFFGRLNDFDYDMVLFQWINSLSPGAEQYIYWGSKAANTNGTRNYAGVNSSEVDSTIQNLIDAHTKDAFKKAAQELDHLIMHGYYFIPLFYAAEDYYSFEASIQHPMDPSLYGAAIETWWKAE